MNREELLAFLKGCIAELQEHSMLQKKDNEKKETKVYSPLIQSAIDYIDQHLGEALSRDSISRELFVSEDISFQGFHKGASYDAFGLYYRPKGLPCQKSFLRRRIFRLQRLAFR